MAVSTVIATRDMGDHPHLIGRQRPVGEGDAQHIGVKLQIDAVHQPQRLELVFGEFAGKPAGDLVAKLGDALGEQGTIEGVIDIHGQEPKMTGRSKVGPPTRMRSRKLPGCARPLGSSSTGAT